MDMEPTITISPPSKKIKVLPMQQSPLGKSPHRSTVEEKSTLWLGSTSDSDSSLTSSHSSICSSPSRTHVVDSTELLPLEPKKKRKYTRRSSKPHEPPIPRARRRHNADQELEVVVPGLMNKIFDSKKRKTRPSAKSTPKASPEKERLKEIESPDVDTNRRSNRRTGARSAFALSEPLSTKSPFKPGEDADLSNDIEEIRKARSNSRRPSNGSSLDEPSVPSSGEDSKNDRNDDHCSTCKLKGRLICCDSCPRSFHPTCVEEGFNPLCLPSGSWECKRCQFNKRNITFEQYSNQGLFSHLMYQLDRSIPKIFSLPRQLRMSFDHVWTNPETGEYVDTYGYEVLPLNNRSLRSNFELQRKTVDFADCLCFKCGRTGMKLLESSFLYSHLKEVYSSHKRPSRTMQATRSDMIKCDFCDLYWHLDCLDPPLSSIPVELTSEGKEDINIRVPRRGKAKLEEDFCTRYQVRKKWMCPCHADWVMPKERKMIDWKWVLVSEDQSGLLSPLYEEEEEEGDVLDTMYHGKPNDFNSNVHIKYRYREPDIIKAFQNKNSAFPLQLNEEWLKTAFPPGLGTQYQSNLHQLYDNVSKEISDLALTVTTESPIGTLALASKIIEKEAGKEDFDNENDRDAHEWLTSISALQSDIAKHLIAKRLLR